MSLWDNYFKKIRKWIINEGSENFEYNAKDKDWWFTKINLENNKRNIRLFK